MNLQKKDFKILEDLILDLYSKTEKANEFFGWEELFLMLEKIINDEVYKPLINNLDITWEEFVFLLKRIRLKTQNIQKPDLTHIYGVFSVN